MNPEIEPLSVSLLKRAVAALGYHGYSTSDRDFNILLERNLDSYYRENIIGLTIEEDAKDVLSLHAYVNSTFSSDSLGQLLEILNDFNMRNQSVRSWVHFDEELGQVEVRCGSDLMCDQGLHLEMLTDWIQFAIETAISLYKHVIMEEKVPLGREIW